MVEWHFNVSQRGNSACTSTGVIVADTISLVFGNNEDASLKFAINRPFSEGGYHA